MKHTFAKTTALCVILSGLCSNPTLADPYTDPHNDGVSAQQGQILLEKWRKDPATPAKLARVTPGKANLAKELKLQPGAYSVFEMGRIAAADDDKFARAVTMMQLQGARPMEPSHTSPGEQALANSMGVDAKDYTLNELARMKFAQD